MGQGIHVALPLRIISLGVIVLLAGCVQAREAAYYSPPKPKRCDIPVYDGPAEDGKIIRCISREEWRRGL